MSIEQHYPDQEEERRILHLTTGSQAAQVRQVTTPQQVLAMQRLVREVPVVPSVKDFALAVVRASRPGETGAAPEMENSVRLGASPRAAQALLLGGKVTALARGRHHVTRQDVIDVLRPVMTHRLLLDFRAQAEGLTLGQLLDALVDRAQGRALPPVSRWTRQLLKPLKAR